MASLDFSVRFFLGKNKLLVKNLNKIAKTLIFKKQHFFNREIMLKYGLCESCRNVTDSFKRVSTN